MGHDMYAFRLGLLAAPLALVACADPKPPATPPTELSAPPALADDGYAELVITADFPGTPAQVRAFLDDGSKIIYAMPDTDNISRPVGFTLTKGSAWTETGAERVLEFADGHYTFERVIEHAPERFAYQVWGFTGATGKNVEHVHGIQELRADPDGGTDFVWTYRVMPTAGWKRPFVQRFVDSDVRELLQTATDRVVAQAQQEMTP